MDTLIEVRCDMSGMTTLLAVKYFRQALTEADKLEQSMAVTSVMHSRRKL